MFVFFEPDVYGKALLNIKKNKKGKQASFFQLLLKVWEIYAYSFRKALAKIYVNFSKVKLWLPLRGRQLRI